MNAVKIVKSASYLPEKEILNSEIEAKLKLEKGYLYKRTGIRKRYYAEEEETIEKMAVEAVKKIEKTHEIKNVGLIMVATTSLKSTMPGISNAIQKELRINPCICLDILAGCSGYINAFDIAKIYIETGKVEKALIIGVDLLSPIIGKTDIGTMAVLSDGAGATLLEKTEEKKKYYANIKAEIDEKEILTYQVGKNIYMNGKEVYKYAVTKTVENVKETLKKTEETMQSIKYVVPHQSNQKILKAIANRLKIKQEKLYTNIENKGNTFCASIPIVLEEMQEKKLLKNKDKILLLGYGGGLNTGSILLEI